MALFELSRIWTDTPQARAFTLIAATVTGVAFGLVPALRASRPDLVPALKDAGDGDKQDDKVKRCLPFGSQRPNGQRNGVTI